VDTTPLTILLPELPNLRVVLLNRLRTFPVEKSKPLAAAGPVCFDSSMLEGVAGALRLIDAVSVDRVAFGSHAPFFYPESANMKLCEPAPYESEREAIQSRNSVRLLIR
jgi:hypothetical protein